MKQMFTFTIDIVESNEAEAKHVYEELVNAINDASDFLIPTIVIHPLQVTLVSQLPSHR